MNIGVCILGLFLAIGNIIDSKSHNKTVEQTWPETYDHNSQYNFSMRDKFKVHYGAEYIYVIIFAYYLIDQFIKGITK